MKYEEPCIEVINLENVCTDKLVETSFPSSGESEPWPSSLNSNGI